jgi:hypothetical protein
MLIEEIILRKMISLSYFRYTAWQLLFWSGRKMQELFTVAT